MGKRSFTSANSHANIALIVSVLQSFGQATNLLVARELEMCPKTIDIYLHYMRHELFLVRRIRPACPNTRTAAVWAAGTDPLISQELDVISHECDMPIQISVPAQQMGLVRPWYVSALFGEVAQ